jgi:ESCRT-I complex subunit VPS28
VNSLGKSTRTEEINMVDRIAFNDRFVSDGSSINNNDYTNDDTSSTTVPPLYENSREREIYDEQANLYAIITATEHLERAYARDAVEPKEYTAQCKKLISQFKLAERVLRGTGMSTEEFITLYQMDCPRAEERLLKMGIPEPMKGGTDEVNQAVTVAETVQHFITTMDAIKLDQRAVDEIQPLLSDLNDVFIRIPDLPNDFEPIIKVNRWLQKLNTMRAVDEISDEDSRQLYHDLDSAYTEFTRYLKRGGTK